MPWAKRTKRIKSENIFYLVITEMQMYGPSHDPRTLPWAKCQIFFETLSTSICKNIDENLNKNLNS